ncbi:hypothetical protein L0F63_006159 [Massospora cicadina]|nr:hypothetical protein L0F63_006159 [Massospora cicadina]
MNEECDAIQETLNKKYHSILGTTPGGQVGQGLPFKNEQIRIFEVTLKEYYVEGSSKLLDIFYNSLKQINVTDFKFDHIGQNLYESQASYGNEAKEILYFFKLKWAAFIRRIIDSKYNLLISHRP